MTVRMQLFFDMGKVVHTDRFTLEPVIEHPILDIGSSFSRVKQHIFDWLTVRYGVRAVGDMLGFADGEYYIDFPTEADMIWFKLRWL